jgi:hypothetical protein
VDQFKRPAAVVAVATNQTAKDVSPLAQGRRPTPYLAPLCDRPKARACHPGSRQRRVALAHDLGKAASNRLTQEVEPGALEADIVVVCHPLDARDEPSLAQQALRQVKANEARAAGDEGAAMLEFRIGTFTIRRALCICFLRVWLPRRIICSMNAKATSPRGQNSPCLPAP